MTECIKVEELLQTNSEIVKKTLNFFCIRLSSRHNTISIISMTPVRAQNSLSHG